MKGLAYIALAIALTACGALNQEDTSATLIAQNVAYAEEIAVLDISATNESIGAHERARELATRAASVGGVNLQLISTLNVVITPTPQLESSAFEQSLLENPDQVGQRLYVNTGVTNQISGRGCAINAQDTFSKYEQRLYGTWIAYQLTPGTLFRVEWVYTTNQQLMFTDSWVADGNYDEICVWFYITPEDVTLVEGSWQARLFIDEVQMTAPLRFTITGG